MLAELAQAEARGEPYDGLLGFSQGANLAALLAALGEAEASGGEAPSLSPGLAGLRFVVPVCGSAFGWHEQWRSAAAVLPEWPAHVRLFEGAPPLAGAGSGPWLLRTPSLHLVGASDPLKPASEKLASLFKGGKVVAFPAGHKLPTQKAAAAALASFLAAEAFA